MIILRVMQMRLFNTTCFNTDDLKIFFTSLREGMTRLVEELPSGYDRSTLTQKIDFAFQEVWVSYNKDFLASEGARVSVDRHAINAKINSKNHLWQSPVEAITQLVPMRTLRSISNDVVWGCFRNHLRSGEWVKIFPHMPMNEPHVSGVKAQIELRVALASMSVNIRVEERRNPVDLQAAREARGWDELKKLKGSLAHRKYKLQAAEWDVRYQASKIEKLEKKIQARKIKLSVVKGEESNE